jgi:hypothetical protein
MPDIRSLLKKHENFELCNAEPLNSTGESFLSWNKNENEWQVFYFKK